MKTVLGTIGGMIVLGALAGNVTHLADWSTTEMVTFNLGTLIEIVGGGYLVYWGFGFKKKKNPINNIPETKNSHG